MRKVGMFEAKTHLTEIIRRVQNGEEVCLTNRDKEVAMIIPMEEYYKNRNKEVWKQWDEMRKKLALTPKEVREFREEGQEYMEALHAESQHD